MGILVCNLFVLVNPLLHLTSYFLRRCNSTKLIWLCTSDTHTTREHFLTQSIFSKIDFAHCEIPTNSNYETNFIEHLKVPTWPLAVSFSRSAKAQQIVALVGCRCCKSLQLQIMTCSACVIVLRKNVGTEVCRRWNAVDVQYCRLESTALG